MNNSLRQNEKELKFWEEKLDEVGSICEESIDDDMHYNYARTRYHGRVSQRFLCQTVLEATAGRKNQNSCAGIRIC